MNIQELKLKSSEQLITQAEELGIEIASTLRNINFNGTATFECDIGLAPNWFYEFKSKMMMNYFFI